MKMVVVVHYYRFYFVGCVLVVGSFFMKGFQSNFYWCLGMVVWFFNSLNMWIKSKRFGVDVRW